MLPDYSFADLEPFILQWWANGMIKGIILTILGLALFALAARGVIGVFFRRDS